MLDILARSIARAAGVEVPDNIRIVEPPAHRRSIFRSLAAAFKRWNIRRSIYLTLKQLDDRTLADIGLHRSMLLNVADDIGRFAVANDNELPIALSQLVANDNPPHIQAECI